MNMTRALAAVTAVALLGTFGCGTDEATGPRAPGCTVAPDEDGLLHDYAADPAIALVPDGASRTGSVQRQHGCIQADREDVTTTSVETSFTLSRDYDRGALRTAYDSVARGHGWAEDTVEEGVDALNPPGGTFLFYCRAVRGVVSELIISTSPAQRIDVRPSGPDRPPSPQWQVTSGGMTVTIEATPERANCQEPVKP
jgi:hypothetical protein